MDPLYLSGVWIALTSLEEWLEFAMLCRQTPWVLKCPIYAWFWTTGRKWVQINSAALPLTFPLLSTEVQEIPGIGSQTSVFPLGRCQTVFLPWIGHGIFRKWEKQLVRAAALLVESLHKLGHIFISSSSCTGSCIQKHKLTGTVSSKLELVLWMPIFLRREDLSIVGLVSEQKYRHSVPCGMPLKSQMSAIVTMGTEFAAVRKQRPKGALIALGTSG